ncbi:afadin- and alpha -actinin-Binding domain-containing protein [Trichoderma breve]|uniref:Afadin- and alpha -actinin-Binding domain-containing protein n=1 Tax=Trichoderma breve TaxID=2034170 RepID=A0A9W9BD41_9HYPO|nr:afadin- and alpha -actinin-Binding domain-containing protein [Trichoderma breve]KAJ4860282.1 afadin- and alpha -actinin-Binding domain-containing protein [Trichoderma breve]
MIDTDNLRTASLYINNQLLSRGLIRDGHDINFADFGERGLGSPRNASRVISLLNDLILRRDRDAEQRESFSATVINLRAENLKNTNDIARLKEKCAEAQRKSDIAATSEAKLQTQLKSAEAVVKGLKDELAKTKGLVAQVRASCATEIRRRDRQIETLKKQVGEAGRVRGTRSGSGIVSITDKDYSLRSETNTFLASLAQNLSEENEVLLGVVRQAKDQLQEMSGWSGEGKEGSEVVKPQGWEEIASELGAVMNHMRNILTNPSFVPIEEVVMREQQIDQLKEAVIKMESRWEDTVQLMDGWRKRMATSGKPIGEEDIMMGLHLSPVRVSGVEETRYARESVLPAVEEEEEPEEDLYGYTDDEFSGFSGDGNNGEEENGDDDNNNDDNGDDDDVVAMECDTEEPNGHRTETEEAAMVTDDMGQSMELESQSEQSQTGPLKNSSSAGNRGPQQNTLRQKLTYTASAARGPQQPAATANTDAAKQTVDRATGSLAAQRQLPVPPKATKPAEETRMGSTTSLDEVLLGNNEKEASKREDSRSEEHAPSRSGLAVVTASRTGHLRSIPRRVPVRLPHPRLHGARPQPPSPSKTAIAAKLAAAEKQADAARARAKLRALHNTEGVQQPTVISAEGSSRPAATRTGAPAVNGARGLSPAKREVAQPEAQQPEKRKRDRRVAKVTSRRRSTLSPFELQSLISGNVE